MTLCSCGHKPATYVTRTQVWIQCNHCGRRTRPLRYDKSTLYASLQEVKHEWEHMGNEQNTHKSS